MKDFSETYDLQAAEIEMMREEILAERVAISLKKSQPQEQEANTDLRLI